MKWVSFLIIISMVYFGWGQETPAWKPIAQVPEAYTIYSIMQLPWSPNIILVAGHDRYGAWHAGLWKSTDYGNSWRYQFWKGGDWDTFLEIEVDEKDYRIWLMGDLSKRGEEGNLYYSLDNGENWQEVSNPGTASSIGVPRSIEIVNQKVYYGVVNDAANNISLYRYNTTNSDPGQWKWETVITIQNADAISELLGVQNNVYLFVRNKNHQNYLFYRYEDNTSNLKYLSKIPLTYVNCSLYQNNTFYAGGDSAGIARIYKSPDGVNWSKIGEWSNNQGSLSVEAIKIIADTLMIGLSDYSDSGFLVYKLINGNTWRPAFNPRGAETIKSFSIVNSSLWCGTGSTFGDVFEATWNVTTGGNFIYGPTYVFDTKLKASSIYFATNYDAGELYRLDMDGTVTKWATFSDATKAFGIIWIDDTIYVGTDDNNNPVKKSHNFGGSWSNTFRPRGASEVYSFLNSMTKNRIILGTGYLGDVFVENYSYKKGGSYIYGPTYVFSTTLHNSKIYFTTNYLNGEIYTIDNNSSVTLWKNFTDASGAWDIVWVDDTVFVTLNGKPLIQKSRDNGSTWQEVFSPKGANNVLKILYSANQSLFLGTEMLGDVFKSTNNFQLGGQYIYGPKYVYDVDFCGTSGFFTCDYDNGEIWKTEDGGNTWNNLTSYLQPWNKVFSLVVFENNIYVGTDYNGDVYKSTDYGKTWVATKDLNGAANVLSLLLSTESKRNKLFAGTSDRGDVFISDSEVMTLIAPQIIPEPKFTSGTSNTIFCRDNGSAGYQFEAANDSLFHSIVERSPVIADTFYTFSNLHDGFTYYYRAYGVTCQYSSLPSAVTFSTQDAFPPKFMSEFPKNGTWVNESKPLIQVFYQDAVGLDTNSVILSLNNKKLTNIHFTDTTIYYIPEHNLNETNYKVTVKGADLLGQASSYQWYFKIDTIPPQKPRLIQPDPNIITNQRDIKFEWTNVKDVPSGIQYYELQFSPDSNFTQYVNSVKLLDTIYIASLNDTIYFWKILAVDSAGNIASSEIRKLEVDATAPATPQPQFPINQQWVKKRLIKFQWSTVQKNIFFSNQNNLFSTFQEKVYGKVNDQINVASPVDYVIRIVTDTSLIKQDTINKNYYEHLFASEGRYYWKVKAIDKAGNSSVWSKLEMFGIDRSNPIIDSVTVVDDAYMFFGPFSVEVFAHDKVSGVDSAFLNYNIDSEKWIKTTMVKKGNRFVGKIPKIDSTYHVVNYFVEVYDFAKNYAMSDTLKFYTYYVTDLTHNEEVLPREFKIQKIWPNPTNGQFILNFTMPGKAPVSITIYNVIGQKVWNKEFIFNAGIHEIQIPANFSSGLYIIVLKSEYGVDTVNGIIVK